jgi:hypothetical protein
VQAVNDRSPHQLAIALKLSPLWWEERLGRIFAEIASINRDSAIECLSAERLPRDLTGDTACLSHSSWQVRSNAAYMLASLAARQSDRALVQLLEQASAGSRPDFLHLAISLARLGTEDARQALVFYLENREPWFAVDAAAALSSWPLSSVAKDLAKALVSGNLLDDYMAVAITRRHKALEFAESPEEDVQEGACELVLALLKALKGPFHSEIQLPEQLEEVQDMINRLARSAPTPRRLAAAIALNEWLAEGLRGQNKRSPAQRENASTLLIRDLSDLPHYECVRQALANLALKTSEQIGQIRHALALTPGSSSRSSHRCWYHS